jgi:mannan endo-1,4-beta-mannosidase
VRTLDEVSTEDLCAAASARVGDLPEGFARARGSQFLLGGEPFHFLGANAYHLVDVTAGGDPARGDADGLFEQARAHGLSVVRAWAFLDADATDHLEALDQVVAAAGRHGIRLILTLANQWPDYGGIPGYLAAHGKEPDDLAAFYGEVPLLQAYAAFAEQVVKRHAGNPTVMAWELMNEPRCPHCPEGLMRSWLDEMAAFVGSLAPAQLVSTGGEGWYSADGQGFDYPVAVGLSGIDYGSFHLYLQHWPGGLMHAEGFRAGTEWIRAHVAGAADRGKPSVLGEVGWRRPTADDEPLNDEAKAMALRPLLEEVIRSGASGALVWTLAGDSRPDYDGYTIRLPAQPATSRLICEMSLRSH